MSFILKSSGPVAARASEAAAARAIGRFTSFMADSRRDEDGGGEADGHCTTADRRSKAARGGAELARAAPPAGRSPLVFEGARVGIDAAHARLEQEVERHDREDRPDVERGAPRLDAVVADPGVDELRVALDRVR